MASPDLDGRFVPAELVEELTSWRLSGRRVRRVRDEHQTLPLSALQLGWPAPLDLVPVPESPDPVQPDGVPTMDGVAEECADVARRFAAAPESVIRVTPELYRVLATRPYLADPACPRVTVRAHQLTWVGLRAAIDAAVAWHWTRAEGQRHRFHSVKHCCEGSVQVRCGGNECAFTKGVNLGCDLWRLCARCRDKRAQKERRRFERARAKALAKMHRRGYFLPNRARAKIAGSWPNACGGSYAERHLTLTIPDLWVAGGGMTLARCNILRGAWDWFRRQLVDELTLKKLPLVFLRAFEWTVGVDAFGHPHFHVWMIAPYLDVDWIRHLWALAVARQGVNTYGADLRLYLTKHGALRTKKQLDGERRPIAYPKSKRNGVTTGERVSPIHVHYKTVHLRIVREIVKGREALKVHSQTREVGGEDVNRYFLGWVISETDSNGNFVSPQVRAELYEALEGCRTLQASKGFMGLGYEPCACSACGREGWFRVVLARWWDPALAERREAWGLPPLSARASPQARVPDVGRKERVA